MQLHACVHGSVQMPEDEKGHKQLGRAHAAGHLAQLALLLVLGVLAMAQPWPSVGQWRAVFGAYGVIYALEASSPSSMLHAVTRVSANGSSALLLLHAREDCFAFSAVLKASPRGVLPCLQASKLIMDHMAKEPFELAWWPILALVLLLANARVHAVDSVLATWAFAGVAVAGYLHYVISVINEICGFLGISCLTIKPSMD